MSGVGLFGVVSYQRLRMRSHEIGVRMALGAAVAQVRRMVLTHTLRVAAAGLAVGLGAALLLSRFVARLLYGVTPFNPATLLAVAGMVYGRGVRRRLSARSLGDQGRAADRPPTGLTPLFVLSWLFPDHEEEDHVRRMSTSTPNRAAMWRAAAL